MVKWGMLNLMTANTSDIFKTIYANSLLERFLRYVKTYSESDSAKADAGIQPSTPWQKDMAALLLSELNALGLQDVQTTEWCYTYGRLPASPGMENVSPICLLAHIDTVEEVTGKDVKPIVHKDYDGKAITLPYGNVLDPETDCALKQAGDERDTIITSDGTTLLGADDKAGVAEIMTSLEYLVSHPEVKHGTIEVIFSPDEETGHGMDHVPLNLLQSKCAYTVDGGHIGELETECFNAFKSDVVFKGNSIHPGNARPGFVNAVCMASAFVSSLPRHQMPETTDGKMGFYAPMTVEGSIESATVSLILRDFTMEGIEKRKHLVDLTAQTVALSYGGEVSVTHTRQYLNMKDVLDKNPAVVQNLVEAYKSAGIEPVFPPIRGGTDGSRLTEMGIPTPNIFTGGHNYHSRSEWASFSQMIHAVDVLIQLAIQWTK
jgi:tripeptide aminopeptidase